MAEPACRRGRRDSEQNVFCRIRILNPPVMDRFAPMPASLERRTLPARRYASFRQGGLSGPMRASAPTMRIASSPPQGAAPGRPACLPIWGRCPVPPHRVERTCLPLWGRCPVRTLGGEGRRSWISPDRTTRGGACPLSLAALDSLARLAAMPIPGRYASPLWGKSPVRTLGDRGSRRPAIGAAA